MAAILSDKAQTVLAYVQQNASATLTASVIAEGTGLDKKSVNGTLTGLSRDSKNHPPLIGREVVEGVDEKVIVLTPDGANFDVTAEKAAE